MRVFEISSVLHRGEYRLRIESNRIVCPMRGEIDVERCFACRALVTIRGDGEPAFVCCRPSWALSLPLAS